jgi:hypothetical protein
MSSKGFVQGSHQKIWKGYNIHAYTPEIQNQIQSVISELIAVYGTLVGQDTFQTILCEMHQKYGPKISFSNFKNNFKQGWIRDPELPGLNSAVLLRAIWDTLKKKNEVSLYKHFDETLNQIGANCIQGISFRLFMDYVAFARDQ